MMDGSMDRMDESRDRRGEGGREGKPEIRSKALALESTHLFPVTHLCMGL